MSGYGDYARHYLAAGWSPLPLPHGKKTPPPDGWTGYEAPMASAADVEQWATSSPGANIALRLPSTVVGIDVDAYKQTATDTMARLTAELGPLPTTWWSSSRKGGSGIYFFALPDDLPPIGDVGPGVETIRHAHRYAVVAPSLHPEGGTYRWYAPDGSAGAPRAGDLPPLPAAWVAHLVEQGKTRIKAPSDVPAVAYEALEPAEKARIDAFVKSSVDGIVSDLTESAAWPVGATDRIGRGWEKLQADKAIRLAALALADWNPLTMDQAWEIFSAAAPTGSGWTPRDVAAKWASQAGRAEAAPMPAASGTSFDLFAGAGGRPMSPGAAPTPPASTKKRPWDDRGNAERALEDHAGKLLYLRDAGTWATWEGTRWVLGDVETGQRAVQQTLLTAATREKDVHYADMSWADYGKLTAKTRTTSAVVQAASWLRKMGTLDANITDFDQRPDLVLAGNGVVDLRSGQLLEPDPSILLLRGTKVAYDPAAAAPEFLSWLTWAQPDPAVRDYLQMVFGASLTGEAVKRYWVHEGVPDAGKSMLLRLAMSAMGDMATAISANLVTGRDGIYGDDYARATLRGARLAGLDETKAGGHSFDISLKQLVGGAPLVGRNPTERPFTFRPFFKLHIATNTAPSNAPDAAISSRLEIVRWDVGSTIEMRNAAMARLGMPLDIFIENNELPGILAWAVAGAVRFYASGMRLTAPGSIVAATDQHMASGDLVAQWLEERSAPAFEATFTSSQGWQDFKFWQEQRGERVYQTQRAWGTRMTEIAEDGLLVSKTVVDGYKVYRGRRLISHFGIPATPG